MKGASQRCCEWQRVLDCHASGSVHEGCLIPCCLAPSSFLRLAPCTALDGVPTVVPDQAPWLQASLGLTLQTTPFTLSNFTKAVVLVATNVNATNLPPAGAHTSPICRM